MDAGSIARDAITLGLLAGGRATRLGGMDKAWLLRDGRPQVLRLAEAFSGATAAVLVSANRDLPRLAAAGLVAVPDRIIDAGPLGALDALAAHCRTPWLFTVPVDLLDAWPEVLQALMQARSDAGARARDADGVQPLVALWRLEPLRAALGDALRAGAFGVQALQAQLRMGEHRFDGVRFGNLNTPDDLARAGIVPNA